MKNIIRISLAFATYPDTELNSFAILVIACLTNNTLFPNLPVNVIGLAVLQTAFSQAITASAHGGTPLTAAKNEARNALIAALRQSAGYVQSLTPTLNLSQVLSSGFDVVNASNVPSPLTQPVFTLDNSMAPATC
jgi:hypothetical protein